MKLYRIDPSNPPHSGYSFTYLVGDLGQKTLKEVGDEFTEANPKYGIDWWHQKFVEYLKKEYGLTEIKDEATYPGRHGVNYVYP